MRDSGWEAEFCRAVESHPNVDAYDIASSLHRLIHSCLRHDLR